MSGGESAKLFEEVRINPNIKMGKKKWEEEKRKKGRGKREEEEGERGEERREVDDASSWFAREPVRLRRDRD